MEYKITEYGKGGLHITLKKSSGFRKGQIVEIKNPDNEGLTEKRVREIVREEIEKLRGEY